MRTYPHQPDVAEMARLRNLLAGRLVESRPRLAEALKNANEMRLDLHAEDALVVWKCLYADEAPLAELVPLLNEIADCLEGAFAAGAPRDPTDFVRDLAVSIVAGRPSMRAALAIAPRARFDNPDVEVDEVHFRFAEAFAAAAAGDWARCQERLESARERASARGVDRRSCKWVTPLIDLLSAVLEEDGDRLDKAILMRHELFLALFSKDRKNPEGLLDLAGLGVLGLAKARGLFRTGRPSSESVYLPVALITGG